MLDVLIHAHPEEELKDTVEGVEGAEVAANRVSMEGNKDDVLHSRRYNP